ncbi:MAG: TlpA disulfide reductase family protein, partial [Salaquimonas sp.]
CAPCRHEMPAFDALQAEFGGDEFEIIPVSVDRGGPEKPLAFYEEIGLKHLPFYQDETMGVFNTLKKQSLAFGLPVTVLLDEEGCILGSLNGPAEWAGEDAKTLIRTALGKSN